MKSILPVAALAAALSASAMDFHWLPSHEEFAPFGAPANWSTEGPDGPAAERIPGSEDALVEGNGFRFDLGGNEAHIGSWNHTSWTWRPFYIRNGTLHVHRFMNLHGGTLDIAPDATLRFEPSANFYPGVNDAATRTVEVRGTLDLTDARFTVYNVACNVRPGGRLLADCSDFRIEGSQKSSLSIDGSADFPKGMVFSGASGNGRLDIRLGPAADGNAVWRLGGDVSENGKNIRLGVELATGRLEIIRDTVFDVSDARFADGADVTIFVDEGATADLSAFGCHPGGGVHAPTIHKTGKGRLVLDTLPGAVVWVKEGSVAVIDPADAKDNMDILTPDGDEITPESYGDPQPVIGLGRILHQSKTATGECLEIALPADSVTANDLQAGTVTLHVSALRGKASWHLPAKDANDVTLVWDDTSIPVSAKVKDGTLGRARSGEWLPLTFELPSAAGEPPTPRQTASEPPTPPKSLVLRFGKGIASPSRTTLLSIAKGIPRVAIEVVPDHTGRNYWIDASCFGDEGVSYTWRYPSPDASVGGSGAESPVVVTTAPYLRRRMPEGAKAPFKVTLTVQTRSFGPRTYDIPVFPLDTALQKPFPNDDVMIGICAYGDPTRLASEMITNELCNLFVQWVGGERLALNSRLDPKVAAKGHADGFRSMTIYGHYGAEIVKPLKEEYGPRYLGNNIGEYAGYLYQTIKEAGNLRQDMDVIEAKEDFVNRFIRKGPGRDGQPYPFVFSTSGSPLATYELQGGIDYICNELYAVGSANLAYASSEARGASRRWGPDYWCSWLAEEWQTFPVPYGSDQKYALLLAGYLQQYVMGTSIIVLESGAQSTQAQQHTAKDPGETREGEIPRYEYDEAPPRRYRETTKAFYDFLRANPRDEGTPETKIAFALGNGDAFVGMVTDWFAVWGQHKQAETNKNWRCGLPEYTWLRVKDTFFPVPGDALKPYPNYWLAGSPYGQCDVISVDDESRVSDLKRYGLVAFAGWNTATPEANAVLRRYMEETDGFVVLGIPHLSTRRDREYRKYTASDCLPSPAGVRVVGEPEEVTGEIEWLEGMDDFPELVESTKKLGTVTMLLAPLELPPESKVVATLGGKPLVVGTRMGGGGCEILFAAWDYPGDKGPVSDTYDALLRCLAGNVPQRVSIAPAGDRDDTRYICFSHYKDKAYLLNMDCIEPRTVTVYILSSLKQPAKQVIEIPPCTVKVLDL